MGRVVRALIRLSQGPTWCVRSSTALLFSLLRPARFLVFRFAAKGAHAGYVAAQGQNVDVPGAFVSVQGLEIEHVADRWIPEGDAVCPRISLALRAIFRASEALFIFAMEMCAGLARPSSLSLPSRRLMSWALVISVSIRASFCCTSWKDAIGARTGSWIWHS